MADLDGKPVTIGGRVFVVPKLRVGAMRRASELISEIDGIDLTKQNPGEMLRWFDAHSRAILELLRGNYPDFTRDQLEDLLDADAVVDVFRMVLAAAGRKQDDQGEAKGP